MNAIHLGFMRSTWKKGGVPVINQSMNFFGCVTNPEDRCPSHFMTWLHTMPKGKSKSGSAARCIKVSNLRTKARRKWRKTFARISSRSSFEQTKGGKTVPNNIDATWRLLQGNICEEEAKNLLSKAVRIFHDRFDKIKAGNIDLIPPMVHGRNCSWNTDFRGMYCAILSVKSSVICAGIIRIFGDEVAEVSLVLRKGLFPCSIFCIEDLLVSLNVNKFVLPAAKEAESMWITNY